MTRTQALFSIGEAGRIGIRLEVIIRTSRQRPLLIYHIEYQDIKA